MSGQIYLNLSACFYTILIAFCFFCKKKVNNDETRIYGHLIIVSFFELVVGFLSSLIIYLNLSNNIIIISTRLYFIAMLSWIYIFAKYVVNVDDTINSNKNNYLDILLTIFFLISAFVLLISDLNVSVVNGFVYTSGISMSILGISVTFMIIICILLGIRNISSKDKRFIPLWIFIILGSFVFYVQMVYPELFLIVPFEVFITSIMYHTIENPDIKMIQALQVAREQADKANHAKTDFLSSMSHEIRTPLNAIVGFSDCIVDAKSLDEAKENARDIVNASQTLLEIVNGILDISKIEAGKIEIVNSTYNPRETFSELAKLITPKMNEKGLNFTCYIAPDIPNSLYGDHANLKKVITNLLSNASKYTESGFVRYEVNCINTKDVSKLIISVEDSGRGIKKENVDKMFTKFQRLDEDRNTTIEGTGLGLAITKQLVELMGGRIIVHTVYGKGSKFTIVINQRIDKSYVKQTIKYKTTLDLRGVRILLVDDNLLNLRVGSKLLEKFNADNVITCDSGFACLEKIKNGEEFDLILLDDMMPKMSGVETLKKLKEIPGFNIPTIALTANAITGMREKYLADGFDNYLAKPINKEQLIQVVNQVLGRSITEELDIPKISSPNKYNNQVRDDVINVTELSKDKKDEIIPVESDIETKLGSMLDLSERDENNGLELRPVEIDHIEEIENLDENNIEVDSRPKELIPVVDINMTESITKVRDKVRDNVNDSTFIDNNVTNEIKYDRSYLEKNGVDVNHALELLGDMDMYNMTINDFMSEIESKWTRINEYKNSNNMVDYAVDVHSLKSDCKYLGFMKLADIAYQHELKSKENDFDFVNEHFDELTNEYNKVLEIAKNYTEHNPIV